MESAVYVGKISKIHDWISSFMIRMKLTGVEIVEYLLKENGFNYQKEFKFNSCRKWKFDFAIFYDDKRIAIEVEGGSWGNVVVCNHCGMKVSRILKKSGKQVWIREGGRHNSGAGFRKDCEKYNAAAGLGWHVLRYTTEMLNEKPMAVINDIYMIIEEAVP